MCVLFRKTVIKYMIPKNMVPKNSTILQGFLVIFYFFLQWTKHAQSVCKSRLLELDEIRHYPGIYTLTKQLDKIPLKIQPKIEDCVVF